MSYVLPPDLPLLPAPRARAMVLLWNPDATLDHFVSVVEGDPALTAATFRAANSAASSPVSPVRSALDAVIRLGLIQTRQIVAAALVKSQFDRISQSGLDSEELWRHLIAVALLAETAERDPEIRSLAFTAGLVHDVGRLALASTSPSRYAAVIESVEAGIDTLSAERTAFGTDHAELGARICEQWRMPAEVTAAVAGHHAAASHLAELLLRARHAAAGAGIGDGVSVPKPAGGDPDPLLAIAGGQKALLDQIRWFRHATSHRRDAAA